MITATLLMALCPSAAAPVPVSPPVAGDYQVESVVDGGTISGVVRLKGPVPEQRVLETPTKDEVCHTKPILDESLVVSKDGGVQWAVVSLREISAGKAFPEKTPVLDQVGCRFVPHVVLAPAGKSLEILNSDGVLHNVHTHSLMNAPVNRSMSKDVTKIDLTFKRRERFYVTCDVHSWMKAWVVVTPHPYFAVTDANGAFSLSDVPPGTYQVQVWHETLGEKEAQVVVGANATSSIDFEFEPRK